MKFALIVMGCVFFRMFGTAWAAEDLPQVMVSKVGDVCTHVRTVSGRALQPLAQKVIRITEGEIVAEKTNSNGFVIETWTFTRDGNPRMRETRGGKVTWEPFQPLYRWPLYVGSTWSGGYQYIPQGGGTGRLQLNARVVVREKIVTKAGELDAFKVEIRGRYTENTPQGSGQGVRDETFWYAPQARCVARSLLSMTRWDGTVVEESSELIDYAPN